ncbi:MAG: GtrA family protein [Rhodoferax sp.]|uniref:GtrA family protein n=1 Tax=Rhodoferax sp. TaxID=50421 RepID=UPI0027364626|nr:GtrA family protein [Rhodoferax sp.]MDP2677239.1 GtrA family protein [Rhodoferax sp.]
MSQPRLTARASALFFSLLQWLMGMRYVKFGLVGASGTVVNMAVLYLAQEHLFAAIANPRQRLYASLALAIAVATVNNFSWNRLWTWADRVQAAHAHHQRQEHTRLAVLAGQLGRYTLASWLGIALQYGLTLWLAHSLHYLLANVIAIVVASVSNFLANDHWTFGHRQSK